VTFRPFRLPLAPAPAHRRCRDRRSVRQDGALGVWLGALGDLDGPHSIEMIHSGFLLDPGVSTGIKEMTPRTLENPAK